MSDDERERPKRSWREIDQMRDGSGGYKRAPLPNAGKTLKGGAAKRYRSQLDRMFSGGGIPEEVKRQAPSIGHVEKSARQQLLDDVVKATAPDEIGRAVDALLAAEPMPEDPDLLAKILAHPKGAHASEAVSALLEVLERGRPANARLLKSRVQSLKLTLEDPEFDDLADCALALL
jgi:hypothetical protein